jgi:sulfur relay protein TusD/DsrE
LQINKTKFALVIMSQPYGYQGASSAYQFCKSAAEIGHCIVGVFFYQHGVLNANQLVSPASDETNLPNKGKFCFIYLQNAIASTSINTSFGRRATSTQERAGGLSAK